MNYDRQILEDLVAKHGSPLYLIDGDKFTSSYRELESAMKAIYPRYRIAYSVKTNYTPYICSVVRDCGGIAEVVSYMEYELARQVGFSPQDIIFNGPFKKGALETALKEGAVVIIDNATEAHDVESILKNNPNREMRVGLRLNFDIGTSRISRFGFDVESRELREVINSLKRIPNVRIAGIHCHFTGARDLERWATRARKMISLSEELFSHELDFIDLGSGMYGNLDPEFSKQFSSNIPTFGDYASAVASVFATAFNACDNQNAPMLITEPGTTLVANAFDSLATVQAVKHVRGKTFAILDTSSHILGGLSCSKNLPIKVFPGPEASTHEKYSHVDFVGYTCLEYDVMYRDYMGPLSAGDFVLFGNVGSYSNGMKPPFIYPGCAAVAFDEKHGEPFLVKRKETTSDIFSSYYFDL